MPRFACACAIVLGICGVVGGDVLAGDLSGPSGDVDQNPGVHITWAWLRDGHVIPGATSWLYSTTSADVGRHLAARETVMWAGHRKVLTSKAYPVVG